jgi:uncharacterized protein
MNFMTVSNSSFLVPEKVAQLIKKYFSEGSTAYDYYFTHCVKVTELALKVTGQRKDLALDRDVVIAGGMLHDIGIIRTNAPEIGCYGEYPYIAHTFLGREILEENGFAHIALVCERHIGTGLTKEDIIQNNLPLPYRDMVPLTIEEKLICYADKFYSKSEKHLTKPRTIEEIRKKVMKYGEEKTKKFDDLMALFGTDF